MKESSGMMYCRFSEQALSKNDLDVEAQFIFC